MPNEPSPDEADRTSPSSTSGGAGGRRPYKSPHLEHFGTIGQLTHGNPNVETDGIGTGSVFSGTKRGTRLR
jgi:hypothetical protein